MKKSIVLVLLSFGITSFGFGSDTSAAAGAGSVTSERPWFAEYGITEETVQYAQLEHLLCGDEAAFVAGVKKHLISKIRQMILRIFGGFLPCALAMSWMQG